MSPVMLKLTELGIGCLSFVIELQLKQQRQRRQPRKSTKGAKKKGTNEQLQFL
jgi:hypothetical protein